jgi:hypothetical protein
MTHADWRDAIQSISEQLGTVTEEQRNLARLHGVELKEEMPRTVAAVALRSALRGPLCVDADREPSDGQLEFLDDLSEYLEIERPSPDSYQEASAWIEVLSARRAIDALQRLELRQGDVVQLAGDEGAFAVVSSIGSDGTVFFAHGRRLPAHRLEMVARTSDQSELAKRAREQAANLRQAASPRPGSLRQLEPHRVDTAPAFSYWRLLAEVLVRMERPASASLSWVNHQASRWQEPHAEV